MKIRQMHLEDIPAVVGLQRDCFPAPFPAELLWNTAHLTRHLEVFPEGQFVCEIDGKIVASASASRISEKNWDAHRSWEETLGGFMFDTFDPNGTTMYGADISVHPEYRKRGIAKLLYTERFSAVKTLKLTRYGTACRIPDFATARKKDKALSLQTYGELVNEQALNDRTLSPLLKMGLSYIGIIENYMDDAESYNAAALLEWKA